MKETRLWRNKENTSLEYSSLQSIGDGFLLEGTVVTVLERYPSVVNYKVKCDGGWRTRHVDVAVKNTVTDSQLRLTVNEKQQWQKNQDALPFADGVFDVDFEISPATNTLPIHRLNLKIGESQETEAVWVRFPSLKLERLKQRYSRLSGRCYKYEAPTLGFEALLEVDESGLIGKYGELWTRIA